MNGSTFIPSNSSSDVMSQIFGFKEFWLCSVLIAKRTWLVFIGYFQLSCKSIDTTPPDVFLFGYTIGKLHGSNPYAVFHLTEKGVKEGCVGYNVVDELLFIVQAQVAENNLFPPWPPCHWIETAHKMKRRWFGDD